MSKRGRHDHLSKEEKAALRRDIALGFTAFELSQKYNINERTVQIHKAKMEGRYRPAENKKPRAGMPTMGNANLCRDRKCTDEPLVGSPFCRRHQTKAPANENRESIISPIPKSRLMAGR